MKAIKADITTPRVDAIVNAANSTLLGGGGVDGAIHRTAGPDLLRECKGLGGCEPGEAKMTRGYRLPAKYVIHTVGPVWRGGDKGEPATLANCYRRCLEIATEHGIHSIAFPSISTGAYGFPIEQASTIAVKTVHCFLLEKQPAIEVVFCCFSDTDLSVYTRRIATICQGSNGDDQSREGTTG